MRDNQPATGKEYVLPDGVTLLSTTDLDSRITYANAAFVEVSGFTREELTGQPHNIVRHPDMPPEAFADLWNTLRAGRTWSALVKNRRKNGDHYWVRANVTPLVRNGRPTGYMSVRTKPSRQEIEAAAQSYAAIRAGRSGHRKFHQGLLLGTGAWSLVSWLKTMPLRTRLRLSMLGVLLVTVAGAQVAGLAGAALGLFSLFIALLCGGVSAALEMQIARPVERLLGLSLGVATGQPAQAVHLDRCDEIGMILRAINQSGLNLRSLVADIDAQVEALQTAGHEIAQGNRDLSVRTENTASSLQDTAASMEEVSGTVHNSAGAAQEAASLADQAKAAAVNSGQVFDRMARTMENIHTSSTRIAEIVGVIDGIAFQTNILALNAAVEAARAGDHGRGFAVVASEVQALARRSAEAAKQIKVLIADSVDKVGQGTTQVGEAGQVMEGLAAQVTHVSDLIRQISHATSEQSTGVGQVTEAVSRIDEMTQQNAALVEQTSAAADILHTRTEHLVQAMSVFRG